MREKTLLTLVYNPVEGLHVPFCLCCKDRQLQPSLSIFLVQYFVFLSIRTTKYGMLYTLCALIILRARHGLNYVLHDG